MTLSNVVNMILTILMRLHAEGVKEGMHNVVPSQPGLTDIDALTQASRFEVLA